VTDLKMHGENMKLITAYFRQKGLDVSQTVQTGSQAHVFSSSTRNGGSFTGSKAAGSLSWPLTCLSTSSYVFKMCTDRTLRYWRLWEFIWSV